MKKVLLSAMGIISMTALAQTGTPNSDALKGRVGINTESPRATMDIVGRPITDANKNLSRGVILPHISDAQKAEFTDKTEGLMIWNTTKKCVDVWNGTTWQCITSATNFTGFTSTKTYSGTKLFTPQCAPGFQSLGPVSYNTPATAIATSMISQEDADQKAESQALANFDKAGQDYADSTCKPYLPPSSPSSPPYTHTQDYYFSDSFRVLNFCPPDEQQVSPFSVFYSETIHKSYTSMISMQDAKQKAWEEARDEFENNGRNYAISSLNCEKGPTRPILPPRQP